MIHIPAGAVTCRGLFSTRGRHLGEVARATGRGLTRPAIVVSRHRADRARAQPSTTHRRVRNAQRGGQRPRPTLGRDHVPRSPRTPRWCRTTPEPATDRWRRDFSAHSTRAPLRLGLFVARGPPSGRCSPCPKPVADVRGDRPRASLGVPRLPTAPHARRGAAENARDPGEVTSPAPPGGTRSPFACWACGVCRGPVPGPGSSRVSPRPSATPHQ